MCLLWPSLSAWARSLLNFLTTKIDVNVPGLPLHLCRTVTAVDMIPLLSNNSRPRQVNLAMSGAQYRTSMIFHPLRSRQFVRSNARSEEVGWISRHRETLSTFPINGHDEA